MIIKLSNYENYLKDHVVLKVVTLILKRYGVDIIVCRKHTLDEKVTDVNVEEHDNLKDIAEDIYGNFALTTQMEQPTDKENKSIPPDVSFEARVVFSAIDDTWLQYDAKTVVNLEETRFIVTLDDLLPGDVFSIERELGNKSYFEIKNAVVKGVTTDVYKKFILRSLGGE